MSIATELTRIQTAKADIKSAIEAKGVTVPSSATIDTYDDYVSQISGGGTSYEEEFKGIIDSSISGDILAPSGATSIRNYAFASCGSLTSVGVPDSVTSIGDNAFLGCTSLTSIKIDGTTPPTLSTNSFDNSNNCPIYVHCENVHNYRTYSALWSSYANRIEPFPNETSCDVCNYKVKLYDNNGTLLLTVPRDITSTSIKSSEVSAFTNSTYSLEFGDCFNTIDARAFKDFIYFENLDLPINVTTINNAAFSGCNSIHYVTIPPRVTYLGSDCFYYCRGLKEVVIPDSVTSIAANAFANCASLSSCTIGSGVTSIGSSMFWYCTSLRNIVIPNNVRSLGSTSFAGCKNISITLQRTSGIVTITSNTFQNANNFTVYVPANLVDTYKANSVWSNYASRIQAIPT